MFALFRRRPRWNVSARVRSRSEMVHATTASLNGLDRLVPETPVLTDRYVRIQLALFELLSAGLPEVEDPAALSEYSALAEHFEGRVTRLREDAEPGESGDDGQAFPAQLRPTAWQQRVLTGVLVSGVVDDAVRLLASARHGLRRARVESEAAHPVTGVGTELLHDRIATDQELRDLLSMWGRRLVGDSMLLARGLLNIPEPVQAALRQSGETPEAETLEQLSVIETFRSELLAAHTRRMEALGLAS
ncbi:MAG: ferritin-like domain-containing protein [Microbacteriaceae bacterium]|nr:ferritin-like domain-containing protein [Microbacteriaceae bacterium]MCI1207286.1 ferritin-like domain-containing protein [Microbacteriaceae bacterium]